MKYLCTGKEMKEVDRYAIDRIGIPSLVLMERAALAVEEELKPWLSKDKKILIICGTGNNGADGLALARLLYLKGFSVTVGIAGDEEKATQEWLTQYQIIQRLKVPVAGEMPLAEYIRLREHNILIDAVFGIGLVREVTGEFAQIIDAFNSAEGLKVAVDIPSGLSADTGKVLGTSVRADITVTFGFRKLGMAFCSGEEMCGRIVVKDIGFPVFPGGMIGTDREEIRPAAFTYTREDIKRLPRRPEYSNKGTFGRVLVIAGSKNMSGAAYLCAKAAYRMGAGLVRILTVEENREILQNLLPEAVITTYSVYDFSIEAIRDACAWATVIAVGPGLGVRDYVRSMLNYIIQYTHVPVVADADALNVMSRDPSLLEALRDKEDFIVTPHLGEMARLTGMGIPELAGDLPKAAKDFSQKYGVICVLKDARTVVTRVGERFFINLTGNSGMATGGSGDVLTGVIAGLLAGGLPAFKSASMGVFIHGLAGDLAAKRLGERGCMASDLLEALPEVMNARESR